MNRRALKFTLYAGIVVAVTALATGVYRHYRGPEAPGKRSYMRARSYRHDDGPDQGSVVILLRHYLYMSTREGDYEVPDENGNKIVRHFVEGHYRWSEKKEGYEWVAKPFPKLEEM